MKINTDKITLSAAQIQDLMDFMGDADPETEITITHFPEPWHDKHEGTDEPAGFYAYFTEYPEEGVYGPLGVRVPNIPVRDGHPNDTK